MIILTPIKMVSLSIKKPSNFKFTYKWKGMTRMEINKMICEHCGKVFYSKYYTGGYIDHYENFSSHKNSFGKDIDSDIRKICFDGNNIREDGDIRERLNCYLKWDNISDNVKKQVKGKLLGTNKEIAFILGEFGILCKEECKILKVKEHATEIVSGMTMLERKYLIKAAEENCNTPFGNEDDKLWEEL